MGTPAWTKRNRGAARRLTRPARALAIDLSALTSIPDPHVSTVLRASTVSSSPTSIGLSGSPTMRLPTNTRVRVAPSNMRGLACAHQLLERRDDYRPRQGGGLGQCQVVAVDLEHLRGWPAARAAWTYVTLCANGTRSWARACTQRTSAEIGTWVRGSATQYRSGRASGCPPMNLSAEPLPILLRVAAPRSTTPARLTSAAILTIGPAPGAPAGSLIHPAAQVSHAVGIYVFERG
jgi:hypothetical protein